MRKRTVCIGDRFGRLAVVSPAEPIKGKARWNCICNCGATVRVRENAILMGQTTSCGCYHRQRSSELSTRHGFCRSRRKAREFQSWLMAKSRCHSPKDKQYKDYGGRGIVMCERWRTSFSNFIADMGPCPDPSYTLDRIGVNGNYEPCNCRWASREVQARNRRNNVFLTYQGKTQVLADWARELGAFTGTLGHYVRKQRMSLDQAIPIMRERGLLRT